MTSFSLLHNDVYLAHVFDIFSICLLCRKLSKKMHEGVSKLWTACVNVCCVSIKVGKRCSPTERKYVMGHYLAGKPDLRCKKLECHNKCRLGLRFRGVRELVHVDRLWSSHSFQSEMCHMGPNWTRLQTFSI